MKISAYAILLMFAVTIAAADAHVKVSADSNDTVVAACSYVKFVVRVPTEKPLATIRLVLTIPPNLTVVATQSKPGWNASLISSKGRIVSIEWSGGAIKPHEFDDFAFLASTPKTAGVVNWDAAQFYADGSVVRWDGPPSAENPHSQTTIMPAACKKK